MGVIRSKKVTIRKARTCFGCLDMLEKGTKANVRTVTDSGQIFDVTLCDSCRAYIYKNFTCDDEFYEGDLKELKESQ